MGTAGSVRSEEFRGVFASPGLRKTRRPEGSENGLSRSSASPILPRRGNSGQTFEELESNAWELMQRRPFESFRIDARRGTKTFPHTSVEINQRVGAFVKERSQARVDLEKAERICWIEITEKYALMYTERHAGPRRTAVERAGRLLCCSPVVSIRPSRRGR